MRLHRSRPTALARRADHLRICRVRRDAARKRLLIPRRHAAQRCATRRGRDRTRGADDAQPWPTAQLSTRDIPGPAVSKPKTLVIAAAQPPASRCPPPEPGRPQHDPDGERVYPATPPALARSIADPRLAGIAHLADRDPDQLDGWRYRRGSRSPRHPDLAPDRGAMWGARCSLAAGNAPPPRPRGPSRSPSLLAYRMGPRGPGRSLRSSAAW